MPLLWSYLKQYKWILVSALALAAVNQIFSLLDPQIFRLLVDRYAARVGELSYAEFFRGVSLLLAAYVGVAFVSRVAKNFQDYFVSAISQRVSARLYAHMVAHSFSLPYAVFEDQRSGELLQKFQKAKTDVQQLVTSSINTVFLTILSILFVIGYAVWVHWMVGLIYFLVIPVLGITSFLITRRIKNAQREIVTESAALAGATTETIRNVELVKSLGLEQQEIDRLNGVNQRILDLELKKIRLIRALSFLQGTSINFMRSLLLLLMLWLVFGGQITLGEFFSLFIYSFFVFTPLNEMGTLATQYQETRASMEQLGEVLAIARQEKPLRAVRLGSLKEIAFRDVSFSYASGGTAAVEDIRLSIAGGDTVAFVGPSGSGKTTLVKLLVGLYRPTGGSILFNGIDAARIDYDALRSRIGLVSQETQLFAGTVRENLLFVRPDATDAECFRALEFAAATSIGERGGKGLDTRIGEGGLKLSGGERQRLAIARALLRNPDLIIFDEATSSLDSITERAITKTIQSIELLRPSLMTVLVAHRLSTVAHARRIYVLERGRIVEQGSHEELVARGGLYGALWREQSASGVSLEQELRAPLSS
ncbi:MAG: ABC transporter ATP-binding protein [Patescibacteria group bacterium]|nr:ABC transporter ATP-binding protein [Patescibacteria group bacterium]